LTVKTPRRQENPLTTDGTDITDKSYMIRVIRAIRGSLLFFLAPRRLGGQIRSVLYG